MVRYTGLILAALLLLLIGQPPDRAKAAPLSAALGRAVGDATPAVTETVGWRRGYYGRHYAVRGFHRRGFYGHRYYRPVRFYRPVGVYRPYRVYHRPVRYWGGPVYGPRCFFRPARYVATPYGWVFRPARRVCRY